jgi:hypothetical protein
MPPIRDLILFILNHHESGIFVAKPKVKNKLMVHEIHTLLVDYFYPNGVFNGKRAVIKYLNKLIREGKVTIDWMTHYSAAEPCTTFTYMDYLVQYEPHMLIPSSNYTFKQLFTARNIFDCVLIIFTSVLLFFVLTNQHLFKGTGL